MEQRPISHTSLSTSVLGIDLGPGRPLAGPEARKAAANLRSVVRSGVTTIALGPPAQLAASAALIRSALAERDGSYLFVVEWPESSTAPMRPASPVSASPVRTSPLARGLEPLLEIVRGVREVGEVLIDWVRPNETSGDTEIEDQLDRLTAEGEIAAWSVRWPVGGAEVPASEKWPSHVPISASLSLLERGPLSTFETRLADRPGSVLVRDPFSQGRLDGSRISGARLGRGPPVPPRDLRALQAEFEPVLQLAPLTRDRRRTLAQAALQYLLSRRWVATTLVPLSSADRWGELQGALVAPPIPEEALRVLGLAGA